MDVLMNKLLMDLDDTPLKNGTQEMTLRRAAMDALVNAYADEQSLAGEDKLRRWELAMKIKNTPDPVEFNAEELALCKKLIAKAYSPLVSGQAWQMLEGKL